MDSPRTSRARTLFVMSTFERCMFGPVPAFLALNAERKNLMFIVHVHVRVKAEAVEAFRQATIENARHSVEEPGVARFDVVQQRDDPARFVLVEVYRDEDGAAAHKETAHYQRWRDAVADLMAEPRSSVKFTNIFPGSTGW